MKGFSLFCHLNTELLLCVPRETASENTQQWLYCLTR